MVYVDQVLNWSLHRRVSTVAHTQQPPGPPFPAFKYTMNVLIGNLANLLTSWVKTT
jgi:hypothetical protein